MTAMCPLLLQVISHCERKAHRDMHRFEKISNIIKQFKLSCSKLAASFQSMEVHNSCFAAFVDIFTPNTYVMVIMSDPTIRKWAPSRTPNQQLFIAWSIGLEIHCATYLCQNLCHWPFLCVPQFFSRRHFYDIRKINILKCFCVMLTNCNITHDFP